MTTRTACTREIARVGHDSNMLWVPKLLGSSNSVGSCACNLQVLCSLAQRDVNPLLS